MASSEITQCLIPIDLEKIPEYFALTSDERSIFFYCIRQGAKNNMGMFVEDRASIALFLRVDYDMCYDFIANRSDLILFDPLTHLIMVKNFYRYVNFGLDKDIYKTVDVKTEVLDKKTGKVKKVKNGETKTVIDFPALYTLTRFANKVKSVIKNNKTIRNHRFVKEWLDINKDMLMEINYKLTSVKKNRSNLNKLLGIS